MRVSPLASAAGTEKVQAASAMADADEEADALAGAVVRAVGEGMGRTVARRPLAHEVKRFRNFRPGDHARAAGQSGMPGRRPWRVRNHSRCQASTIWRTRITVRPYSSARVT